MKGVCGRLAINCVGTEMVMVYIEMILVLKPIVMLLALVMALVMVMVLHLRDGKCVEDDGEDDDGDGINHHDSFNVYQGIDDGMDDEFNRATLAHPNVEYISNMIWFDAH